MKKILAKIISLIKDRAYTKQYINQDVWIPVTDDFLNNPNHIYVKIN